jgi:hypothetical protein
MRHGVVPVRTRVPHRQPPLGTALGAIVLALLCAAPVAAQGRSAGIRVSASVRDAAHSDVIGAHAVEATDPRVGSVGVSPEAGSWRITSGWSGQVGLQIEAVSPVGGDAPVSYVTICDDAGDEPARCRRHVAPVLRMSTDGALAEFVVRVGGGSLGATADTPVRLTIAFIAL